MIARIKANSEHMCPVCGKYEFPYDGSFDTCEVCGWVDDPIQLENPDEDKCANRESLNEYREKWKSGWRPKRWNEEDERFYFGGEEDGKNNDR